MAAATAKATEVKKPKTFWMRVRVLCIVAVMGQQGCQWVCLAIASFGGSLETRLFKCSCSCER